MKKCLYVCWTVVVQALIILFSSCDKEYSDAMAFLCDNQSGHYTERGTAVEPFLAKVYASDPVLDAILLKSFWEEVSATDKPGVVSDEDAVTSEMLRHNTEKALEVWRKSPWKGEVSFEMFCKYILPYRCTTEIVKDGWRDTLFSHYHSLIEDVSSMKRALEIIHDTIQKRFRQTNIKIPYTLSVIDLDKIRHGSCGQRAVYEVAVMRALGIPAAVDGVSEWANYSANGHTWAALITTDGTYTVARGDSVVRKNNPIDSSVFELKKELENDHPFDDVLQFQKMCAKIERHCFERMRKNYNDTQADRATKLKFSNPFVVDVTDEYGRTADVVIETTDSIGYLCVFATGGDWTTPVAYATGDKGMMTFERLRNSVAYIYGTFKKGVLVTSGNPFILCSGRKIYLNADTEHTHDMTLARKYPLTAHFLNYWMRARGALFEASNDTTTVCDENGDRRFKHSTLLADISRTPSYKSIIFPKCRNKYRYLRYVQPKGTKHTVTEIQYYSKGTLLRGNVTSSLVSDVDKCLDGDAFTYAEFKHMGAMMTDFGKPVEIDRIVYIVQNDDNYVVPDNDYELLYYDNGWHSLGRVRSDSYEIEYKNVPSNAMYLLRNKTKGKEERIFTYENGRQIWW